MTRMIRLRPIVYIAFAWMLVSCGGTPTQPTDTNNTQVENPIDDIPHTPDPDPDNPDNPDNPNPDTPTAIHMKMGTAYPLAENDTIQGETNTTLVDLDTDVPTGNTTATLIQGSATIVSE